MIKNETFMKVGKIIKTIIDDDWHVELFYYYGDKVLNYFCRMCIYQHESLVIILYFEEMTCTNTVSYSNSASYTQTIIELLLKHNIITINGNEFMCLSESVLLKLL